jgi:phage gpG-like protein
VADLRVPLSLIANDFRRSEQAIFKLKGPGQYPDLKDSTKAEKTRLGYGVYPILKRTGRLGNSLTNKAHEDAIHEIVNKDTLIVGTKVPYANPHQDGAPKINLPMRKVLFIGPEAPRFATSDQMGRLGRWNNILNKHVLKVMEKEGFDVGTFGDEQRPDTVKK